MCNMAKETASKSKSALMEVYSEKRGICITVVILGVMIGIFAFAYVAFGNDAKQEFPVMKNTTVLVTVVFQHGEVVPITFPTDPSKDDAAWKFGRGELTKKGRQNMYALGKFLRDRYHGFLPEIYYPKEVTVLSSESTRCHMSAALLLAGLYPPHSFQIWNAHLMWQPIPVKEIPSVSDKMLDVKKECPSLSNQLHSLEESVNNNRTAEGLYWQILKMAQLNNTNSSIISTLKQFYDMFLVQEMSNFQLPDWAKTVYPEKLSAYATQYFQLYTSNPTLIKLGSGVLLEEITHNMALKAKNNSGAKIHLYAVHDVSIFKLLHALNLNMTSIQKPNFGSSVIVELHKENTTYSVEVFYLKRSTSKEPIHLNFKNCESPCPLDTYSAIVAEHIPKSWEKECQL